MKSSDFEGRKVNVKVTARSDICVSYCLYGRRHIRRRLGIELSSSIYLFSAGTVTLCRVHTTDARSLHAACVHP